MIYMSSNSSDAGSYTLTVTFAVGTDPNLAQINVSKSCPARYGAVADRRLPTGDYRAGTLARFPSWLLVFILRTKH